MFRAFILTRLRSRSRNWFAAVLTTLWSNWHYSSIRHFFSWHTAARIIKVRGPRTEIGTDSAGGGTALNSWSQCNRLASTMSCTLSCWWV